MPLLSSALLELWLDFWLSNLPMELLVVKVILMGRFLKSFVMNFVSFPTCVNFAHLRESLLSFGSGVPCRFVCLSVLLSICDGLYLLFPRICLLFRVPVLWLLCQGGNCSFCSPNILELLVCVLLDGRSPWGLLYLWWSAFCINWRRGNHGSYGL